MTDYNPHPDAGERWDSLTQDQIDSWRKVEDQAAFVAQISHDITVGDITEEEAVSMISVAVADVAAKLTDIALTIMNGRKKQ